VNDAQTNQEIVLKPGLRNGALVLPAEDIHSIRERALKQWALHKDNEQNKATLVTLDPYVESTKQELVAKNQN